MKEFKKTQIALVLCASLFTLSASAEDLIVNISNSSDEDYEQFSATFVDGRLTIKELGGQDWYIDVVKTGNTPLYIGQEVKFECSSNSGDFSLEETKGNVLEIDEEGHPLWPSNVVNLLITGLEDGDYYNLETNMFQGGFNGYNVSAIYEFSDLCEQVDKFSWE